jgi:hypothetical protein
MIVKNSLQCLICLEEVVSTHRHDFRRCSCGNVAVDGGKDYLKRSVRDLSKIKDTSILKEEE